MLQGSIAAAAERVGQSRRELRGAVHRLEASVSRPSSLLAAAAVGVVVGFSLTRFSGVGALARALSLYVRYRTEEAGPPRQDARMSTSTPQLRTLRLALEDCDGEAHLARVLGVSLELLSRWLSGQVAVPTNIYVRALDLVATGR
jgi:hypothetical protein